MFFNAHFIVQGVFWCDTETSHEVCCGESCVPATPPKDWHLLVSSSGENVQEKHSPLQLKPTLVRHPASSRSLAGARPVPPIPRLASPLPDRVELQLTKWRKQECEDTWLNEVDRKLAADLSELSVDDEEVDQEEVGLDVT